MGDASQSAKAHRTLGACIACRQRKVKCSGESTGCANCIRTELPCVYPVVDASVKKKRGPYRRDGQLRERHLVGILKEMERKVDGSTGSSGNARTKGEKSVSTNVIESLSFNDLPVRSTADRDSAHPPFSQVLELWHIYASHVDPCVKLIHCPSFAETVFKAKTAFEDDEHDEALLFCVYYAALSSISNSETIARFGNDKDKLLTRYRESLERRLASVTTGDRPCLRSLQALTLFMVCLQRTTSAGFNWSFFVLAINICRQLLERTNLSFFNTEMLRRAWWTLCRLESRQTEDENRSYERIDWSTVPMPLNLNDVDLDPNTEVHPVAREGVTDMTFVLVSFELKRLGSVVLSSRSVLKVAQSNANGTQSDDDKARVWERMQIVADAEMTMETKYLRYCHESRPFDWLSIAVTKLVLSKLKLLFTAPKSTISTNQPYLSDSQRFDMSLEILHSFYLVQGDPRFRRWAWFFRDFVQWQALKDVLTQYCRHPDSPTGQRAWAVLNPILSNWEKRAQGLKQSNFFEPVAKLISQARKKSSRRRSSNAGRGSFGAGENDMEASSAFSVAPLIHSLGTEASQQTSTLPSLPTGALVLSSHGEPVSMWATAGTNSEMAALEAAVQASSESPYTGSEDMSYDFEEMLEHFDWEAWTATAQNMDFELSSV